MTFGQLKALCREDLLRFGGRRGYLSGFWATLRYHGFRITLAYRIARFLRWHWLGKFVSPFFILLLRHYQTLYNTQISHGTEIGAGLYIPHVGGIVINPRSIIGSRCYLAHNVTLGKVHFGEKAGVPMLGDDVFVGVGVVILGNVKIGDNVAIGANSVVIDDLPDNCFAAGSPARVVSSKGAKEILGVK